MLELSYLRDVLGYTIGISELRWYSSYLKKVRARNGIFILEEIVQNEEEEVTIPRYIFAGSLIECELEFRTEELIINWKTREVYFSNFPYLYYEGKRFRYKFFDFVNTDEIKKYIREYEYLKAKNKTAEERLREILSE
jgi:hypothetical protein